jgi:outer membrane lipase/esterase
LFVSALLGFLLVAPAARGAVGGSTATNTVNYTYSTKTVTHTTVVELPMANGATAQTLLSSLLSSYQTEAPTGLSLDATLTDPVVLQAVALAKQRVVQAGGTVFADAKSAVIGGSPVHVGVQTIASNVSATTTMYIGPQTILVGDNQSQSFTLLAGYIDYDTLITTDVYQNDVYQLTGTTLIADLSGPALLGTTSAGKYEVVDTAPVYSLAHSAEPVVLYQRAALLGVVHTATRDVNGRLFRLRSEAGESAAPASQPSGDPASASRWRCYAAGDFGNQNPKTTGSQPSFDSHTSAGTLGGEYVVSPQVQLGFAGTELKSHSDLGTLGRMDIKGWEFSAYGSWTRDRFYVDGLYGYGRYADEIKRNTLLGTTATAKPDATTHTFNLNSGYNLVQHDGLVTGPTLGLDYTRGNLDGYAETGGGTANVAVSARRFESLLTDVGWQVSYAVPVSAGRLTFQARTSWQRENLADRRTVQIGLVQSPFLLVDPAGGFTRTDSFGVAAHPASAEGDYWVVGGGVKLELGRRSAVLLDYEEHLLHDRYRERFVSLRGEFRF